MRTVLLMGDSRSILLREERSEAEPFAGFATLKTKLLDTLTAAKQRVLVPGERGLPDVIVVDPARGIVVVDFAYASGDVSDASLFVGLNRKVKELQDAISLDAAIPVTRVVLHGAATLEAPLIGIGGRTSISPHQLASDDWLNAIPTCDVDESVLADIIVGLFPSMVFKSVLRRNAHDEGVEEREIARIVLDLQQASIAQRHVETVALIEGPPGSGKSLVLAARAKWLAAEYPEWNIQVLCYNRALAPYLRSLTVGFSNISVSLFSEFARECGVRFSFSDDAVSRRGLAAARLRGSNKVVDALLIDEVQDFRPPWIQIAYEMLRPGRGGMVLAGDTAQALYHDLEVKPMLETMGLEILRLDRPYRSTRRILSAIGDLDPGFEIAGVDSAPDGEPIELIWADSWDEQAKCVAWEIAAMIESGDRSPGDIGVLVTTKYGTFTRLSREFEKYDIPFTSIGKLNSSEFDRDSNTVKIMTVHSSKGHEFPVVFLFGLESLPAPDLGDEESIRRARVGFVGATRAKDQLLITYTKDNKFLEILSNDDDDVRRWLWPDSYEGVSVG